MEIRRSSIQAGGLSPRAINVLSSPISEPLFHTKHGIRHPLGLYNVSLSNLLYALKRVLTLVEDLIETRQFLDRNDKEWITELAMAQRLLLYFLTEHRDDCKGILSSFFEDERDMKENKICKRFFKKTLEYNDYIARGINRIKHHRGEISITVMFDNDHVIPGYSIEATGEDGAIEPYKEFHRSNTSANSFARDLRFHFCWIYIISEHLSEAIIEMIEVEEIEKTTEGNTRSYEIFCIAERIAKLPNLFFPDEVGIEIPQVDISVSSEAAELLIALPGKLVTEVKIPKKLMVLRTFIGDGVTKSFRLIFPPKDEQNISIYPLISDLYGDGLSNK